jgi:hypothetical protein
MKDSIIVPDVSQSPQVPIRVSRPAWKLWKYLEGLYRIGGWISPNLRHLARYFKRAVSTIKRWLGELFAAKVLRTKRRGPRPPLYTVLIPTTDTCNRLRSLWSERKSQPTEGIPPTPPCSSQIAQEPTGPGSYQDFAAAVADAELPQSSVDQERARRFFFELPVSDRQAAIAGLRERIAKGEFENPTYRPRPDNYIRNRVWERPVKEKPAKRKSWWQQRREAVNAEVTRWAREMDQLIAKRREERAAKAAAVNI